MYVWTEEIEEVYSVLPGEQACEIAYEIARNELIRDGYDPNSPDFDDAVLEESDYIGFYRISTSSALYSLLQQWYASRGQDMESCVRGYYVDYYGNYMYFVTGCGYDIYSADLLGGSADGLARREFDEFVRSKGI